MALVWTPGQIQQLLFTPHKLLAAEPWKSWIRQQGGLTAVYTSLRKLPLRPIDLAVLEVILDDPGASVLQYAERLHLQPSSYHARKKALLTRLAHCMTNLSPQPSTAQAAPAGGQRCTPHNLPAARTSFVGREQSLASGLHAITTTRLLTLTGAGGSGKSRLALQLAEQLLDQYPDGVWLVELAAISDPALIPSTLAAVLQVSESPEQPILEALLAYLGPHKALIVLDNCEHLLAECAEFTDTLLRSCPELRVLVTSREALNIAGEVVRQVPTLHVPSPSELQDVATVRSTEAVQLLIDRVEAVQPQFALTENNVAGVVAICQRLDGIPLALELVAARFRLLTVDQILARLGDRFKLLTRGSRTALPRQQTLRALIDWSYDLLTPEEQIVFRRLAVFAGGWDLEAAEQVVADTTLPATDVLDLLSNLVQKSLVMVEPEAGGIRYHMLETIREYGAERLEAEGETAAVTRRHAEHYTTLAETADTLMKQGEQDQWVPRLEAEQPNLRAALTWAVAHDLELAAWEGVSLGYFWTMRGYWNEGRRWYETILKQGSIESPLVRARTLHNLGIMAASQLDYTVASAAYEEALGLHRELGNTQRVAGLLCNLGIIARERGEYARAAAYYEEALALARESGADQEVAFILTNLGVQLFHQGHLDRAEHYFHEVLPLYDALRNTWAKSQVFVSLGSIAYYRGQLVEADRWLQQSFTIASQSGNEVSMGEILEWQSTVAIGLGQLAHARELLRTCVHIRQQKNLQSALPGMLEALADLLLAEGQPEQSAMCLGHAAMLREKFGPPSWVPNDQYLERIRLGAVDRLGAQEFAAARKRGSTTPVEDLLALILEPVSGS